MYDFYKRILGNVDVVKEFQNNLVPTNRTNSFFVNWDKVKKNTEKYNLAFSILDSLINTDNADKKFYKLIKEYPEIIPSFPILFATRELELTIVEDFNINNANYTNYKFNYKRGDLVKEADINKFIGLFHKLKLFELFKTIKHTKDYVLGVEVGLDTNARKNRSGTSMEDLLLPVITDLSKELNFEIIPQKKFKKMTINTPVELKNRKADFILIKNNKLVNIEVNFYNGAGSKPEEIVDSYINRYNELNNSKCFFIWITDGFGYKTSNQIEKAFNKIPYVLNIHFVKKGLLKQALTEIFKD